MSKTYRKYHTQLEEDRAVNTLKSFTLTCMIMTALEVESCEKNSPTQAAPIPISDTVLFLNPQT